MLPLKSIKEEKADCIAAFKGVKVGAFVEYCHHSIPIEVLTEPAKNRIEHISTWKDKSEQAKRFRYFRPHREALPSQLRKAYADWEKANADRRKALIKHFPALAEQHNRLHPESPWNSISLF